jgi:hypothetical protein
LTHPEFVGLLLITWATPMGFLLLGGLASHLALSLFGWRLFPSVDSTPALRDYGGDHSRKNSLLRNFDSVSNQHQHQHQQEQQ